MCKMRSMQACECQIRLSPSVNWVAMRFAASRTAVEFGRAECGERGGSYELRISDWSSDVCSSDLDAIGGRIIGVGVHRVRSVELHRGREADVEDAQPGDLHRAHLLSMDYIFICAKCDPCKRANVRSGCRPRSIGSKCGSPPRGRRLPSRLAWPMAAPS